MYNAKHTQKHTLTHEVSRANQRCLDVRGAQNLSTRGNPSFEHTYRARWKLLSDLRYKKGRLIGV